MRVHNTVLDLVRKNEVGCERLEEAYVYLHTEASLRAVQLQRRRELVSRAQSLAIERQITDRLAIDVLLVLLRHRGADRAQVVRHLQGHSPPISSEQVGVVFARYDLDGLGEKVGQHEDLGKTVADEKPDDVLEHGEVGHRHHRFRTPYGQRPQSSPVPSCHNHGFQNFHPFRAYLQ